MNRYSGLVAVFLLAGCGGSKHPGRTEANTQNPVPVSVVEVQSVAWPVTYEAPGTVRAAVASTLASKVMGYVREIKVQPGDRVSAGQLLVVIDARDLESSLLQARAAEQEARSGIAEADNAIAAAKAQLSLAQVTFKRMEDLFAKKSISNQEFDEAQARLRSAEAAHQMAVAKRNQLDARIAQAVQGVESASVMRSYGELRAPFAGVVTEKRAEAGVMATPGTPLLTIEQAGAYRLEAAVQESMLSSLRTGQSVSVVLDTMERPLSARVAEIVPAVDPASRTFLVKAALPSSPLLRSGLFGRLRISRGAEQTVAIPAAALMQRGSLHSVFVADNGIARTRMITTGEAREGQIPVLSGLQAGDHIVYPRPANVRDGDRLEVRK